MKLIHVSAAGAITVTSGPVTGATNGINATSGGGAVTVIAIVLVADDPKSPSPSRPLFDVMILMEAAPR